ncbi:bifunctional molybdopterin-guanine dinucleotide biosynthesis adaptor protein MobB/molybdopterin molybdotransferase MoeA [Halomonas sp. LR5S13]|uniref:bifunctional molybdopterin-guanine dinucleotide biosynthesis adaptor protein MobB/molybdopterin molybdotransferase MoeA n=1 Tax=Halomonas rhizosphaerae TaxID=3043296 RepID=UPI0024A8C87A|nr:bifunctional molybdopterin-guanine dinucleotide biosynthesis adaptor protein MobB/molybdopterin molybdotransferase MoeA [Halomonas rhizosphaerae]MDI5921716.1 bifunctional molybdopterin-guanine dinucleotide biosynthesis adaptor protein MobB/molybdopterin molybdotransferase MoeA [Halomonas rhizosphaerae]
MTLSCFDLGERMLPVEEARVRLASLAEAPLPAERVALAELHGRVLAEDVVSPIDVPQNTNAAMDGIALAWPGDAELPGEWRVVGEVLAGSRLEEALGAGECVRITTGAPLPPGADTVIMLEQLEERSETVVVHQTERVKRGQHVRQAGEDIPRGQTALRAGNRLGAAELGLLASLGLAEASVHRRPRVAIFSTGDEVTAPGEPLPPAGIFDANRHTLAGLLAEQGAELIDLGILPDDRDAMVAALGDAAGRADMVITSGGVSVGHADFTRAALEAVGRLAFWRIAIRPGRPLACGLLGERGVPFLGLPGNPVAVMVTFLQFVAPLLSKLQGRAVREPLRLTAIADEALKSRLGRTDFLRGCYHADAEGRLHVRSTGAQGSGILSSMVAANCLIELTDEREGVAPGETVSIQPLHRLP